MIYIFDLDGTCVDSSHRLGKGSLASWKRNNTPENVAKDKPTVLAEMLRHKRRSGYTTIVCTSRVIGDADAAWLAEHDMVPHYILSRTGENDMRSCATLKAMKLAEWAGNHGFDWPTFADMATIVDDDDSVLETLGALGVETIDAKRWVA